MSPVLWKGDTSSRVSCTELLRIFSEHLQGALILYVPECKGELCELGGVVVTEVILVRVKEC